MSRQFSPGEIQAQNETIALMYIAGRTTAEVAAHFGMDKRTVQRRVQNTPGLREQIDTGRRERVEAIGAQLADLAPLATDRLRRVLQNDQAEDRDVTNAARVVLMESHRHASLGRLNSKIERLEALVAGESGLSAVQ